MSNPQTCYYGRARPTSAAVKLNTYTPQEGEVIVGILDICNTDSNTANDPAEVFVWVSNRNIITPGDLLDEELYIPGRYIIPRANFQATGVHINFGFNVYVASSNSSVNFMLTGWLDKASMSSTIYTPTP